MILKAAGTLMHRHARQMPSRYAPSTDRYTTPITNQNISFRRFSFLGVDAVDIREMRVIKECPDFIRGSAKPAERSPGDFK